MSLLGGISSDTLVPILTGLPEGQRLKTLWGMISLPEAKNAVPGTGLRPALNWFASTLGVEITPDIYNLLLPELPGIFGDYPVPHDKAPSAVFIALFGLLAIAYLFYFVKGVMRGHRYWPFFGLFWYAVMRTIGMGCRLKWANNLTLVDMGIVSVVFSFLPELAVLVLNMLLAHRLFTWRHPETGNSIAFNLCIDAIYFLIVGVVLMGVLGQLLPYVRFMDASTQHKCNQVMQAAAVLNLLYALSPYLIIFLSYALKPGMIDHRVFRMPKMQVRENLPAVVQPSWIQSTGLFWFPAKGAQTKMYSGTPAGKAIRVMPTREHPANGLTQVYSPENPSGPRYKTGVLIVLVTTTILSLNTCFRVASTFYLEPRGGGQPRGEGTPVEPMTVWVYRNYPFYIFYCACEWLVSVIYIATRVDLRFYLADMPRRGGAHSDCQVQSSAYNDEKVQNSDNTSYDSAVGLHRSAQQPPINAGFAGETSHYNAPAMQGDFAGSDYRHPV